MSYIKVSDFTPPIGAELSISGYPGEGIYCFRGNTYIVLNNMVWMITGDLSKLTVSTSEVDIYKLLAVALHKEAAVKYV